MDLRGVCPDGGGQALWCSTGVLPLLIPTVGRVGECGPLKVGMGGGSWEKGPKQGEKQQEVPRSPPYPESSGAKSDNTSLDPVPPLCPAEGVVPGPLRRMALWLGTACLRP